MTKMPAIALRGMTILPGMIAHFDISRDKSIKAVEVAMNLNVNFDQSETVKTELGIPNGMDGGAVTQESLYDMVTTQGYEGGVPGTDTNDDTTYVIEDDEYGRTEISESDTQSICS